jgi:hypothetical protein
VLAAPLSKWTHPINIQCKPYHSKVPLKIWVRVIEILSLLGMGWMSKLSIVFALISQHISSTSQSL